MFAFCQGEKALKLGDELASLAIFWASGSKDSMCARTTILMFLMCLMATATAIFPNISQFDK